MTTAGLRYCPLPAGSKELLYRVQRAQLAARGGEPVAQLAAALLRGAWDQLLRALAPAAWTHALAALAAHCRRDALAHYCGECAVRC